MLYPIMASLFTGSLAYYIAEPQTKKEIIIQKQVVDKKIDTFNDKIIDHYVQRKKEQNKLIIYSKLHKCPLSTHQYIDNTIIKKLEQTNKTENKQIKDVSNIIPQKTQSSNLVSQNSSLSQSTKSSEIDSQQSLLTQHQTKKLYQKIFKQYSKELISSNQCQSVQLIYGPIFSKDTPYKASKQQIVKNVYTSNIKISKNGQYLTDRNYTIVICNSKSGHYYNAFSYRKSNYDKYKLLNYISTIKKLEEQTGLIFNLDGKPLMQYDFQGLAKQRLFSEV